MIKKLLVGAILALSMNSAFAVNVGDTAPKSPIFSADQVKGKVIYVDFWASWCPPCAKSFPWMNELNNKYGKHGLKIVAINVDENKKDAETFIASKKPNFEIRYDTKSELSKQYKIKGMPTAFILDQNGKVKAVHEAFNSKTQAETEKMIKEALGL